jgi:F0F1-type ATP synthase assembly protein I
MSSAPVPESLLKKRKRDDAWRASKHAANAEAAVKAKERRKIIFKKAEAYVKEYRQQVRLALGFVDAVVLHCALSSHLVARDSLSLLIIDFGWQFVSVVKAASNLVRLVRTVVGAWGSEGCYGTRATNME